MILRESASKHEGKTLSHFENQFGKKLDDLYMVDELIIVFTDGSKIKMDQDWRGSECYWSQRAITNYREATK